MPSFTTRLSAGMERAREYPLLALVPVLLALLDTDKIVAIATFDGGHIGFKFGLPLSVVTIWQFVSVPNSSVTANTGLPIEMLPLAVVTVPVLLVVQAAATAGYFGSIRNALDRDAYDFSRNVRAYFVPFLVLTAVPFLAVLPLAVGVFGVGALAGNLSGAVLLIVIPVLLVFLVAAYLFYATPYLLVLRDVGVVDAARASYALAVDGGPYVSYAVGFSLFVLVVSPFATAFVVNVPLLGIPVGILGGSILGLGANFATMRFVADLDPESAVDRSWDPDSSESPE
ncbi:hypothetical protein [Halobellus inordinatus]|uniref:hypothetical protein n=1 Tax=Halobellus inordinatus TaxID=1126236 RepID=UPI002114BF03|nr:hypothetical protein [Halobellus ramosii]